MVFFTLIYLFIGFNLFNVISDKSNVFYKDVRFWLVIASLIVLVFLTIERYPAPAV